NTFFFDDGGRQNTASLYECSKGYVLCCLGVGRSLLTSRIKLEVWVPGRLLLFAPSAKLSKPLQITSWTAWDFRGRTFFPLHSRGRIIDLREAGWSNRRIGRHLGRSDMVVARCWQQWITEGKVYRRGGSGRPRNTNDREDRAIRRVATSAPTTSLASIQRHLPPSRHPVPSRETIRRRLTEVGLRSRRPLRRLPLTPHHRQCRLDFCRPRTTWSVTDWRRVIFSDESRFSLSADDHRTRVWRRTGQRSDPAFIVEHHTAISQGVTVWGAISWDTRSSLLVLQGTLTARRYVDDILTPIVLPMLSSRPGAIYQQDNARPHTARLSQQCLQGYDVLPWPARSPDLSPIEHVCDALGRQLQPSRDTGELTAQMQRLWQDLPQGVISDLIESMPRRISACIAARGGFTTY
ncbi:transposable element Tcb1 transposase, partial [Trichonephila clavipes]